MKAISHQVLLKSDQPFGRRLPPLPVGLFLEALPCAIDGAVSMELRHRSSQSGKRPEWLRRAVDIRLVDMQGNGESTLFFEAPPLGEADHGRHW